MPVCSISNCKSRTGYVKKNNIMLYTFPQDNELQKQWLAACQRNEGDLQLYCAAICERHFTPDCIEEKWTQRRSTKNQPRVIRRLKKGSIPTELLNLPKERRVSKHQMSENPDEPHKKIACKTRIPSYSELVACARRIQGSGITQVLPIESSSMQQEIPNKVEIDDNVVGTENFGENEEREEQAKSNLPMETTEVIEAAQRFDVQQNKQTEMLLDRLKKMEEEKEQLAIANKQLAEENQQLKNNLNKNHDALQQLNKNMVKNAETKASDTLRMVFTPGQVKRLMSPSNNRIMWSAEDISSAIALRSVSARAYNYLRDVKNIPLPCVQTLRNWGDLRLDT